MSAAKKPAAVRSLAQLIDYAGLFPPAALPLDEALREFERSTRGTHADMLGKFIVPASQLREAFASWRGPDPLRAAVILDAQRDPKHWFSSLSEVIGDVAALRDAEPSLAVEALEVPLPPLAAARESYDANVSQLGALLDRHALRALPCYVEFPRDARWESEMPAAIATLARVRLRGKLRCGGLQAHAFPDAREVAAYIVAVAENGVPFKATAGLHHPVARRDEATGFPMHGFLNLLLASSMALAGAPFEEVETVIAEHAADAFTLDERGISWRGRLYDGAVIQESRANGFVSYGSCSFVEPLEDLREMGWL